VVVGSGPALLQYLLRWHVVLLGTNRSKKDVRPRTGPLVRSNDGAMESLDRLTL